MNRWSKKELEQLDNITFAIAVLNERRQSTSNAYSLLNQKISAAIKELEKIKEQKMDGSNKQKEMIDRFIEMLPNEPRSYDTSDDPGFWTDGKEILCPSEAECEVVAEFLKDVISEYGNMPILTGRYNSFEEAASGEQDKKTGFNYIRFE